MSFRQELHRRAGGKRCTVVLAEGWDERVAAAARRLEESGIAETILLHPDRLPRTDDVADLLEARRPGLPDARKLAANPVVHAAGLVALGDADAAVAGATCPTADVVRAALRLVGPAHGIDTVSSAFYMYLPDGHSLPQADQAPWGPSGVLTFTDAGVVPLPTVGQLAEIAVSASRDRRRVVGDEPVVAFLSYSTTGSAEGSSVSKMRDAVGRFRELAPDIVCDGELQGDAALVPEVALRKAPDSPVGGRANVLVFPDLDSGNIAYKLVQRLAGSAAIGPILQGLTQPVADLSRGASAEDIVDVAAVAVLQTDNPSPTLQEVS